MGCLTYMKTKTAIKVGQHIRVKYIIYKIHEETKITPYYDN